ncbi:MAG: PAS domain S-box protein [Syntrophobacteraceae bacterium]|nr:PAS domain S-box protein [Syntrophobacteraceae bacterium]
MKRSRMSSYPSIFASWSVRKKLLAAAMILFLSAGTVIVRLGLEKRSELIAKANRQALLIVDGLAVQQREITMGTEYLLSAMAQAPAVRKLDGAACNELLRGMNKLYPFFTVIGATTSHGVLFASSKTFQPGMELSGRRDIREAIKYRRFRAGDLAAGTAGRGCSINFSYPVEDENGKLHAVLTAGFEIGGRKYAGLLESMHLPAGSTVNYVDRNGIRFWRLPSGLAAPPGKCLASDRLQLIRAGSERGYFEGRGADGVFRLYAFARLRLGDTSAPYMYVMVGIPQSEVIAEADRAIAVELSALGAIGVVALLLTLFFVDLSIARPIENLVMAAQRLGRGEGSARTGLPRGRDEFGRLAEAFDTMAELLEKRSAERQMAQEALAGAYAESETLVRKRTAELSKANAALTAEIAERKLVEEERERLVTAIEQSADAIVITDTDWIISYVNPAFTVVTGYESGEVIGRHLRFLKSGEHSRAFYRKIRQTLNRGEVWSGRVTNRKKDGALYETEASASPVRNQSGTIVSFVSSYRDLTARLKLEKEVRQAHKMEALGALAGGIAHDFNNILAAILGHAEIALYKLAQDHPVRANIENVLKAGGRAADLVRRILAFSRQREHARQPVVIVSLVEETLNLLAPSLPPNITMSSDASASPQEMVVLADPTEIHQVLINLCTNAAYAMSERGGVLLVTLSRVVVSPSGQFQGPGHAAGPERLEPGPYVCLSVSDTGVGIDPAVLEKIFDPYFTTKPVGEGTGLGLSVVQGIVKSYGGEITVQSEPGKGAIFRVFLRALDKRPPADTLVVEVCPDGLDPTHSLPRSRPYSERAHNLVV